MAAPLDLAQALAFAHLLADEAGPIARRYFRQKLNVKNKPDQSPVTVADREIEAHLRGLIRARYPDHGILGEEQGRDGAERDCVWVLDPIDGTKSFIAGMPLFGTLIALLHHGRAVLGLVDHPVLRERWIGRNPGGATLNGEPCRTSGCERLADAIVMTTSPDAYAPEDLARFHRVSLQARLRRFGGDCYMYALLASGHVDAVFGARLEPYDFMPMVALVQAAGGVISDWQGQPLSIDRYDGRVLVSASAALHAQILRQLNAPA